MSNDTLYETTHGENHKWSSFVYQLRVNFPSSSPNYDILYNFN